METFLELSVHVKSVEFWEHIKSHDRRRRSEKEVKEPF